MKKYNVVYLTINLLNNKKYVGDHSTNNLEDGYLGSGTILSYAFKKYGKNNFKCKILEQFDTKEMAFNAQEKYIKEYNTLVPNGYNISPKGGHGVSGCFSKETLKKLSDANKGKNVGKIRTAEQKLVLSLLKKNKTWEEIFGLDETLKRKNNLKERLKNNHPLKGKQGLRLGVTLTIETKIRMSNSAKGKKMSHIACQKMSAAKKGKIPWNKGLKLKSLV